MTDALKPPPVPEDSLRWRDRRERYRPTGEVIDPSRYEVTLIDRTTGARFVRQHHYSGSYVASRVQAGLFWKRSAVHADQLVGVCAFSVAMNGAVITRWCGVKEAAGLELGRLVLLDEVPGNGESWFVRRSLELLHEALPGLKSVVSFSDPLPRLRADGSLLKPGHVGGVYAALGACYAGRSKPRRLLIGPDGRTVSPRSLSKLRRGERGAAAMEARLGEMGAPARRPGESGAAYVERVQTKGLEEGWLRQIRHQGNHAYLFALLPPAGRWRSRRRERRQLQQQAEALWPPALPYPRIPDSLDAQQVLW